jgi:hypothetical protein
LPHQRAHYPGKYVYRRAEPHHRRIYQEINNKCTMALVNYSDSESDTDVPPTVAAPKTKVATKSTFQTTQPGRIRVDLPSLKPETGENADDPPAKRARTGGAFSGFNNFLPPPKKPSAGVPKKVINFKTSSEAAFSRASQIVTSDGDDFNPVPDIGEESATNAPPEVKLTGKNTMFVPESVKNRQKLGGTQPKTKPSGGGKSSTETTKVRTAMSTESDVQPAPRPKEKQSLFSFQPDQEDIPSASSHSGTYEPLMSASADDVEAPLSANLFPSGAATAAPTKPASSSSLSAVVADMDLTPAQRRQLFGRNYKDNANTTVTSFNLDSEYANNEAMRQAGEVVQHRAIKTIAPGKHSLQQLVNNARTQKDAIEDSWAEGRKNRAEGGSKYGWGSG